MAPLKKQERQMNNEITELSMDDLETVLGGPHQQEQKFCPLFVRWLAMWRMP
jgi:hypothetical protein